MENAFDRRRFAASIRTKRGERSLRAIAGEIGTSFSTLDRLEQGTLAPDVAFYVRLCNWLEVAPQEFFIETDGKRERPTVEQVEILLRSMDPGLDPDLIEACVILLKRVIDSQNKRLKDNEV